MASLSNRPKQEAGPAKETARGFTLCAGAITDCSATGVLHGGKGDGLVGFNRGSLNNCQVDVTRR